MADTKWAIRGEYMESCNCDYLCPCVYTNPQGPVTYDNCYAVLVFRIDNGDFGVVRLDGCKFAFVLRSGKVMADGNWIFAVVIDESADASQRDALAKLAGGEAGGTPGLIRNNLVGDFRGVDYKPIEFAMSGHNRRAAVPGLFAFDIDGVLSRNRSSNPLYIDNTGHPANTRLALAQAKELHVHGFGLDLDMSGRGNNGHFAPFAWTN
jgi:hypothetical protein